MMSGEEEVTSQPATEEYLGEPDKGFVVLICSICFDLLVLHYPQMAAEYKSAILDRPVLNSICWRELKQGLFKKVESF